PGSSCRCIGPWITRVFRSWIGREFYILGTRHCATFAAPRRCGEERNLATAASSVVVVAGERLARYGFPDGHPFGPDRHAAFIAEFAKRGLDRRVRLLETRAATRAELESFHTSEYLDLVEARSRTGEGYLDGGDTPA